MHNALALTTCLLAFPAWAQESGKQPATLFSGKVEHGGFGGPVVKITTIDGNAEVMVGGRGGWIINHTFVLGGGGYGVASETSVVTSPGEEGKYEFGHGGLEMEYIWRHQNLVHGTFLLHVGAGSIEHPGFTTTRGRTDSLFVLEPTIHAELNVVKFFRVAVGGGYRFVFDVDVPGLQDSDLSGPTGVITLKFGWF